MSTIKVNTITTRSGSTVTLGESGKTIALACGASQTGFGRTGTVNWCTTAKTSPLTAESGKGYFINTTSGAITVTLPASPSAGDIVAVKDYTGTAGSNAITIGRNSSKIRGACACFSLDQNNAGTQLIYVDGTEGWKVFNCGSDGDVTATYICASGGTITTSGDYKIHTFTSSANFVVNSVGNAKGGGDKVSYMVVAGGGGSNGDGAGGGGAGGFREGKCSSDPYTASPLAATPCSGLSVPEATYPITIGAGGTAGPKVSPYVGTSGANSVFSSITSTGGGRGGHQNAADGGSGGGGGRGNPYAGGSGNTPPVSPAQGTNGASGGPPNGGDGAGGGGGATVAGSTNPGNTGGAGGAGATTSITGSPTAYAGGGGGGTTPSPSGAGGAGGTGGGGNGASHPSGAAVAGTTNTGGGGGGSSGGPLCQVGANGGSGVVIIRYKYQN